MAQRSRRARESATKAGEAAHALRENQYVQRLIEDEELRANLRSAFQSGRNAYTRMRNGRGPARAVMEDKKVQRELRRAAESLREASDQLRGKQRKGLTFGRVLLIGIVGAGLVLIFSESARKAILDRLFGPEEEFEYTSTTSPSPEAAAT
jgi:hypothetical protein